MKLQSNSEPLFFKVYPAKNIKEVPILFFIHGFADCGDEFLHLVATLTKFCSVVLISLPGFGEAPKADEVSPESLLPRFEETLKLFQGRKILVGYSMGGRYALYTSLFGKYSDFDSLVLVSSSTGIADENGRELRLKEDLKLCQFIEEKTINDFVDYWLRLPIFKGLERLSESEFEIIKKRKAHQEKLVLIQYLKQAGQGVFPDLSSELKTLQQKLHIVVGENDAKYCEIGKLLHQKLSNSELHIFPNTGHAVHRENPNLFLDVLKSVIEKD